MRISALYPSPRPAHSCVPTHVESLQDAEAPAPGATAVAEASATDTGVRMSLRPSTLPALASHGTGATGMTVCLIDPSGDVAERSEELCAIGRRACLCARCVFGRADEGGGGGSSAGDGLCVASAQQVASGDLRVLLASAEDASRYEECVRLVDEMLRRDPSACDALRARARILGWSGQWSASHDAAVAAVSAADPTSPEYDPLESALRGTLSYAGWASAVGTIAPAAPAAATAEGRPAWNAVEGLDDRAFVAPGLLVADECAEQIRLVEAQLEAAGGWTTSRHYDAPTTDVPLKDVPSVARWFNTQLENRIYPALGAQFDVAPESIRVVDAFVVRYSAAKQRSLPLHTDQSQFSLTVAMNGRDEYVGGGTFFLQTGAVANCEAGGVISFDGSLEHSGWPIVQGTRYIIVAFLYAYVAPEEREVAAVEEREAAMDCA